MVNREVEDDIVTAGEAWLRSTAKEVLHSGLSEKTFRFYAYT